MHANLVAQLTPAALKRLGGTDLEYDAAKLEQLADVVPDEQDAVLRAYLTLHVPWTDALVGKTLRSSVSPRETPPPDPRADRRTERLRVDDLKPNRFNASLFPDSLSEASIALLADDMARNGQRVPGEVTPDGIIVDCERRWRAAKLLGWDEMNVTVVDGLTDDDILDRVLDACTSVRHLTVREQVNVYAAVHDRLKREAGRQQGRPEKTFPNGNVYLTPRSIHDAAAKRAGFSSAALASRAEAMFARGSDDVQAQVREGTLSISAAYEALPKRGRAKDGLAGPVALESDDEPENASQGATTSTPPPEPTSIPDSDQLTPDQELAPSEVHQISLGTQPTESDDDEGEPEDDQDSEPCPTDALDEEPDIGVHVSAVCRRLSALAELNYEDAVAWFDQVIEEMRASLGEPPEFNNQEEFDE